LLRYRVGVDVADGGCCGRAVLGQRLGCHRQRSAERGELDAHPDANNVLTTAVNQPPADAKSAVRGYFIGHPGEFLDLKNIAQPLLDLRGQCNTSVSPGQLAALFDALSG
jgi:hemophore-related protein